MFISSRLCVYNFVTAEELRDVYMIKITCIADDLLHLYLFFRSYLNDNRIKKISPESFTGLSSLRKL